MNFKAGDRVLILRKDIVGLKPKNREGIITNINGQYIDVRLKGQRRIVELYPNEIKKI